jgi:DNA-binding MarR family transcriptional regulator
MGLRLKTRGVKQTGVCSWMRLARIFHKVDRLSTEQMRRYCLTMAQFDVLAHVGAREGMTQQELADSLLVTKGNVCQILDRMERGRLIVRRQQGRANCLFLTEEGQRLFQDVVPAQEALIEQTFSALTSTERAELLRLLRKLDRDLPDSLCGDVEVLEHFNR